MTDAEREWKIEQANRVAAETIACAERTIERMQSGDVDGALAQIAESGITTHRIAMEPPPGVGLVGSPGGDGVG